MVDEKLFLEKIQKVDCGNYEALCGYFDAIFRKHNGAPWECMSDAFNYGFLQGQKAQKKAMRQKDLRYRFQGDAVEA